MRVSIWQQFSSNNSSSYVIVGSFATPQKANEAAVAFKTLLQRLWEWYQSHPEIRDAVLGEEGHELTDAERFIMSDYGIEFEQAMEWVAREETLEFLPDAVTTFENLLFVATVDETVTSDTALAQFMHQLGADVKFEEAMESYLVVNLSAHAPNDITAQFIKSATEAYFAGDPNIVWHRPPWVLFYDGQLAPNLEPVSRDIDTFIEHYYAWRAWHDVHRDQLNDLSTRRETAWRTKDDQTAKILNEQIMTLLSHQHEVEPRLPDEVNKRIFKIMSVTSIDVDNNKTVAVVESIIKFPTLYFNDYLGHSLPAIVTWLRALGCKNVTYEFVPIPRH